MGTSNRGLARNRGMAALCLLGAAGALTSGMWQAASASTTAPVGKIVLSPVPIAATGSLKAKVAVPVIVTAETTGGTPIGGATVYLSFVPTTGGGTATAHKTSLTSTLTPFKTDAAGTVRVTYRAPAAPTPKSGTDTLTAANAATAPTVSAADTYIFARSAPPPTVTSFAASPSPIAATKSLAARGSVTVTITAFNATVVVPHAFVYLSFQPVAGGGTAAAHGHLLTSTPQLFKADANGVLKVVYRTGATVPTSGTDTITFANAPSGATVTGTDTYSF